MVATLAQTAELGKAFKANRSAVFESIQRLRTQAHNAGTLKTTPQQEVEKKTTSSGQQVIVIEPANPQVVYVPQYNPQVVYVQAPATTTVVVQESSSADAAVAGLIGFTAGIAIGAAVNNNYYYGPYGWRGGAYMYNDAWDDYYDHREDAREDWQDHREDLADERGDRAGKAQEERTERAGERTERTGERQGTASTTKREGTAAREGTREGTTSAGTRQGTTPAATTRGGSTYESRGHSQPQDRARTTTTQERSGTKSDAFSGYSSGKSERAASSRGKSSRSSSRSRAAAAAGGGDDASIRALRDVDVRGARHPHRRVIEAQRAARSEPSRRRRKPLRALTTAAAASTVDELRAIFGADGQELFDSSDPATARRNREVFTVAMAEGWRLLDQGTNRKTLIVGNEDWPFPVPLVKSGSYWRFDTAAGKEEVLARRIGRNELAVIAICRAYVKAQHRYAQQGHDGKPAGLFATALRSDPGKQNGLYWPTERGQPRSPLGDLVAQAAEEGRPMGTDAERPTPFHGYYFKMLTSPGGFGLVAWPVEYDATGVMTFVVNQDGVVREKDLGAKTHAAVAGIASYKPDKSWKPVAPAR